MWEIILIGCAGIIIGLTFGYVWGHDVGCKQRTGNSPSR